MKLVFVSNYFNHHQKPLCDALSRQCESFFFVSSGVMREERRQLGYGIEEPAYVIRGYESAETETAKKLIREADVILCGAAKDAFTDPALYRGKPVFYVSERLFKSPEKRWQLPLRAIRYYNRFERGQQSYLLCSGAYTAADFSRTGTFRNRCFKWGYFPETKQYDINDLLSSKDPKKLLWCGRMLGWKHPEYAKETARRLKADGVDFSMELIGIGEQTEAVKKMIALHQLQDRVELSGAMKPSEVRSHMEKAGIFLFTSDRQEGWGAVLNEAMNSGCAVIASDMAGATSYLVKDGINGLSFHSGDCESLYQKARRLLEDPSFQKQLGLAAYDTITGSWNAETAASRVIKMAECLIEKKEPLLYFDDGPGSKAMESVR